MNPPPIMPTSSSLLLLARSDRGRKAIRYSVVSLLSTAISQATLFVTFGLLHQTAATSNIVSCAVATVPSYYLNRNWAWGKTDRSRFWREVVPFWGLAFLGLAFSTWAASLADTMARQMTTSHLGTTLIVMLAALWAFGLLWVARFFILNRLLFVSQPQR
jgi:putative flippase GtrA